LKARMLFHYCLGLIIFGYDRAPLRSPVLEKGVMLEVALTVIMILDFVTRYIHIYDMHNNYVRIIHVVSNMLFSESSY